MEEDDKKMMKMNTKNSRIAGRQNTTIAFRFDKYFFINIPRNIALR